jgi:hypothetical protein
VALSFGRGDERHCEATALALGKMISDAAKRTGLVPTHHLQLPADHVLWEAVNKWYPEAKVYLDSWYLMRPSLLSKDPRRFRQVYLSLKRFHATGIVGGLVSQEWSDLWKGGWKESVFPEDAIVRQSASSTAYWMSLVNDVT